MSAVFICRSETSLALRSSRASMGHTPPWSPDRMATHTSRFSTTIGAVTSSLRAAPLVRAKVNIINAVCEESSATPYDVLDLEFGFHSHEWILCSKTAHHSSFFSTLMSMVFSSPNCSSSARLSWNFDRYSTSCDSKGEGRGVGGGDYPPADIQGNN